MRRASLVPPPERKTGSPLGSGRTAGDGKTSPSYTMHGLAAPKRDLIDKLS